jgi:hypothetical protein
VIKFRKTRLEVHYKCEEDKYLQGFGGKPKGKRPPESCRFI